MPNRLARLVLVCLIGGVPASGAAEPHDRVALPERSAYAAYEGGTPGGPDRALGPLPAPAGANENRNRDTGALLDELRVSLEPWEEVAQPAAGPPVVPALPAPLGPVLALLIGAGARRSLRA